MFIKSIELENFRNYVNQKIVFSRETNIIYGNNAQGKTNILEGISMFSAGKSFKRAADRDLIKFSEERARVFIEFESNGTEKNAEIIINRGKAKFIKLCGTNLYKTSDLLGKFKCVVFSPEEMALISGAPELRRSFADLYLSSEKPLYYDRLKRYYKILKQKNNLLKKFADSSKDTLDIWNEELAGAGAKIMMYRKKLTENINPYAEKYFDEITNGGEKFEMRYQPSVQSDDFTEENLKNLLYDTMTKKLQTEMQLGAAVVGIHRDDFNFFINGQNTKQFCSQGQQRTSVIALKMAQAEILKEKSGEYPVFLLDDIMSELDMQRRTYISDKIKDKQVIITCTDKYKSVGAKYFYVENGTVTEKISDGE